MQKKLKGQMKNHVAEGSMPSSGEQKLLLQEARLAGGKLMEKEEWLFVFT